MALSLSSAKLLSSSLLRGYATTSAAAFGRSAGGIVRKVEQRVVTKEDSSTSSAWAPDPVTGYYRPANCAAEIDPAELREMLLNQRVRPQ